MEVRIVDTPKSPLREPCPARCVVAVLGCFTLIACTESRPTTGELAAGIVASASYPDAQYFPGGRYVDRDPFLVQASFAVGQLGDCSAFWIGPNLVMSSPTCRSTTPRVYHRLQVSDASGNPGSRQIGVDCDLLVQSSEDPNVPTYVGAVGAALYFCDDITLNGRNYAPGNLLGELDWDLRSTLSVNTPVNMLWHNPDEQYVPQVGAPIRMFLSGGRLTGTGGFRNQSAKRFDYDVCNNQQSEGGAVLNAYGKLVTGPHTGGWAPVVGPCGQGGMAAQARSVFEHWSLDTGTFPDHSQPSTISHLGLTPANYDGAQDKNGDYRLDLQADLEAVRGEPERDIYWLGLESHRRNAIWTFLSSADVSAQRSPAGRPSGSARFHLTQSGSKQLMSTRRISLRPNQKYRVALEYRVLSSATTKPLTFEILQKPHAPGWPTPPPQSRRLNTDSLQAFEIESGPSPVAIRLMGSGPLSVEVYNLTLIEQGAVVDFDTSDERVTWLISSRPSYVVPEGRGPSPDWALAVIDRSTAGGPEWGAYNQNLALVSGVAYKICFTHWRWSLEPVPGVLEVWDHSFNSPVSLTFDPDHLNPTQTCTPSFVANGPGRLIFGALKASTLPQWELDAGPAPMWDSPFYYLVDDIEIIRLGP